ncbi:hypothetical protein Tco_1473455 [Tanacetum coccineum]
MLINSSSSTYAYSVLVSARIIFSGAVTVGASTACTAEDFDTTGVDPLSNSFNIRLYSNSSSFDVVTVAAT